MGKIFNIPGSLNFAESLAAGILQRFKDIENISIYLPSKRAILTVSEAFLKISGKSAMLLPNMQAIGDIDDDELEIAPKYQSLIGLKVISNTRRQYEMAKLLHKPGAKFTQSMMLAKSLISLIDEMQNNGANWGSFENIIPQEFAQHWQITLDFLRIAGGKWQKKLMAEGLIEPVIHRNLVINAVADFYDAAPPTHPVIIAGSTGSLDATANFIKRLAAHQNGYVVLSGLDKNLNDDDHKKLEETHPQFLLSRLLLKLGAGVNDVQEWQQTATTARQKLISASLLPTHKTNEWQNLNLTSDIELAEFDHIENEAIAIALILRDVLEQPEKTAMVITNNRALARRIAAKMKIWDVNINDSAGQPLLNTPTAHFLILLAEVFANKLAPVDVLAFFKHPYIPQKIKDEVRANEKDNYHCPRKLVPPALPATFDYTELAAFFEGESANLKQLINAHLKLAEEITDKLWNFEGQDLQDLLQEAITAIDDDFKIEPEIYPEFLRIIFSSKTFRPKFGQEERVNILSPIEARLQNADIVIIADMNEGSMPELARADSWTNQKIRRDAGLDLPQKKIGQNAHDYELLAQNSKVILTRSTKINGSPASKSRFWQRLEAVSNAPTTGKYSEWINEFYKPKKEIRLERPAPKPPAAARPTELSATKISKLIRDPYTIYAEKILGLKRIDDVDRELSAADFGNFIHDAFEKFGKNYDGKLESLLAYGKEAFRKYENFVGAKAFWWSKFERLAAKFIELENDLRKYSKVELELTGTIKIGGFTLSAKADRIEITPDGIRIIDYKTGTPPAAKFVQKGLEPQLAIEAIIFEEHFEKPATSLEYWHLKGKDEIIDIKHHNTDVVAEARENIPKIIVKMQDENTPFIARPWSYYALAYNDYEHLERIKEWS